MKGPFQLQVLQFHHLQLILCQQASGSGFIGEGDALARGNQTQQGGNVFDFAQAHVVGHGQIVGPTFSFEDVPGAAAAFPQNQRSLQGIPQAS